MGLSTTPRTWVADEVVTPTEMNTEIRDAFTGIQAAWTSYTPTLTGITLGNGTRSGRYLQVGKTIDFRITFTLGSSSSVTGSITATLPVTALDLNWLQADGSAFDTSAAAWWAIASIATSTTIITARIWNQSSLTGNQQVLGSGTPFTWATGDVLTLSGRYEAA